MTRLYPTLPRPQTFDLSCAARDNSDDAELHNAVAAGAAVGAIFKEPTITPTEVQQHEMGLKKAWGSPNGAMRRGWNGITISRDTIHIPGIELGYKRPVFFERHAVGGEYGAGWKSVGRGRLTTTFFPDSPAEAPVIVDARHLVDEKNVVVVYHNPLDNVRDMAHHFFSRCLAGGVTPYVVTKKTVFKWQEAFWQAHKEVFDRHYREDFRAAGLLGASDGELVHLISDAATMQIIRWTDGGFGMSAHNYDGDMLTDEVSQVHRSPGFITSNLIGRAADGRTIKEFEASHGTVADMWHAHLRGEETSLNPLGMAEALIGAMEHAGRLAGGSQEREMAVYGRCLREALHETFRCGEGTRDLAGASGLTTEAFVARVGERLTEYLLTAESEGFSLAGEAAGDTVLTPAGVSLENLDQQAIEGLFRKYDADGSGSIGLEAFTAMMVKLGLAPAIDPAKRSSASLDQPSKQQHSSDGS